MLKPTIPGVAAIGVSILLAMAVPIILQSRTHSPEERYAPGNEAVVPRGIAATAPIARRLFLEPLDPARLPETKDAPQLIGIVGRLPDKAVAMVRTADGTTKILSPGQAYDGWRLESLSPDAALFTRSGKRVRSFLPAPEPQTPDDLPEEDAGEGF